MENTVEKMKDELTKLNPTLKSETEHRAKTILGNIKGEDLNLPEGYYYSQTNESITNEQGNEGFFYEYDPDRFVTQPKTKCWLVRVLFGDWW